MTLLFISVTQTQATIFLSFCAVAFIIGLIQIFYFKGDMIRKLILLALLLIPVIGIFLMNIVLRYDKSKYLTKG
jgi:hypothetical protein